MKSRVAVVEGRPIVAQPAQSVLVAAHAWYDDLVGGSFRLATEFARHVAACGAHVSYVCCDAGAEPKFRLRLERIDGIDVWRYPAPTGKSRADKVRHHISQSYRLARRVNADRKITAVSGHTPLQFLGVALAARRSTVHLNYMVHSPFDEELRAGNSGGSKVGLRLATGLASLVDRASIRLADRVQANSRYTLDVLIRKYGQVVRRKGVVAPGWVDVERFQPATSREAVRRQLGTEWQVAEPLFFTLRRLEPRMGLDRLVLAAEKLRREGLRFRVLIGGSGSLRDELSAMIRDRNLTQVVKLLGRIPEDDLPTCYAAADCFVLPTRALECFGLIVLEAYACGTPVIASRVGAIPELVERSGSEWLYDEQDVEQLAARMRDFMSGRLRVGNDLRATPAHFAKPKVLDLWTRQLSGIGVSLE